jgi:hypothetical protein
MWLKSTNQILDLSEQNVNGKIYAFGKVGIHEKCAADNFAEGAIKNVHDCENQCRKASDALAFQLLDSGSQLWHNFK